MVKLGALLHFFGPDGAGKTTQANMIIDYYKLKGLKVKHYWIRSPHTVAYFLSKLLVSIGFYREIKNDYNEVVKKPLVQSSRFLKTVWFCIEFAGVLPLILKADIYLLKGYTLVADRYLIDTITSVAYLFDDPTFSASYFSKILFGFIPRNAVFIFLDTDADTIMQRRFGYNTSLI